MKVAVIIPVYNAEKTIESCLESIVTQEVPAEEIILVDNSSTDDTVKLIKSFQDKQKAVKILLLSEQKKGAAAARNKGIKYATSDIVAFTDSDCVLPSNWLKNMLYLYDKSDADAIGGLTYVYNPKTLSQKLEALDLVIPEELKGAQINERYETLFGKIMGTFNCSCRRRILEKIGGFDEAFNLTGEDVEFTIRVFDSGFKVLVWHPELILWHMPRRTYPLFLKKIFQYRLSPPVLMKKHFKNEVFVELPIFGLKKIRSLFGLVITQEFIVLLVFLILLVVFYKKSFLIALLGVAILIGIIFVSGFNKRKMFSPRLSLLDLILIIPMDIFKKIVSWAGKIYGGLRNGYFHL